MSGDSKIRVGSRKSELALIQTNHVVALLKECHPDIDFEIVTMSTLGDKVLDIPLPKIGEKSLFTKELETALVTGGVDFVVHSLKDLPTVLPEGMAIGAVLRREDPRDALVLQKDIQDCSLKDLPENSVIGTSSLRRTAQIAKKYPHLKVENIRGNLNTRLKKLDDLGMYQAIILAAAGLIRIGWKDRITKILDTDEILYAVGQGALAVECRANDQKILELLSPLYDAQTALRVIAERSFLKTLGGGCSAPVAVSSNLSSNKNSVQIELQGAVWSLDGKEEIKESDTVELTVTDGLKCASCLGNRNKSATIGDIESLKRCNTSCANDTTDSAPLKKLKLDITSDVLKTDPHEHCPIEIPVGADFMGKCPYLDGQLDALNLIPIGDGPATSSKCPYANVLRTDKTSADSLIEASSDDVGCFVGLVPHKNVSKDNFEKARKLGKNLALKLVDKGAKEIMSKAQAIIHGQTNISNVIKTVN